MGIIAFVFGLLIFLYLIQKITKLKNEIDYLSAQIKHLREDIETKTTSIPTKKDKSIEEVSNITALEDITTFEKKREEPPLPIPPKLTTISPAFNSVPEIEYENNIGDKVLQFLKENFLTVIGIITLVLGIGYFVKYAIDQNWINETMRMLIGLVVGGSIIGIGHYLRRKYDAFSALLVGGGISVLYFTITIAFREYHLFEQNYAFIYLTLITLLSIVLSYLYNQQVLYIFSLLGGFAAPLMISTGESNYIFLYSYLFILLLGNLVILYKKQWFYPGCISFVLAVLFLSAWSFDPTHKSIFVFLGLYYTLFIVYSLLPYYQSKQYTLWQQILFVGNTFVFTVFGYYAYTHYYGDFTSLVPFLLAFVSLGIWFYFQTRQTTLAQTALALAIALITLGIGIEFEASTVTALWAIQSSLMLYLFKSTRNTIFKQGFIALIPFFGVSLIINWLRYVLDLEDYPILFNPVFMTSCFVFICSLVNIYLIKDFKDEENFFIFKIQQSKNLFSIVSILFIYLGLLFEIIYQSDKHFALNIIAGIALLYSIYFLSLALICHRPLNINTSSKYIIGIINFTLMVFYPLTVLISDEILIHEKPTGYYFVYAFYILPFVYFIYHFFQNDEFHSFRKTQFSQWFVFGITVFIISYEVYNAFIIALTPVKNFEAYNHYNDMYRMIILPIVWAILGFILIYSGFKKNEKNLPIMGFVLFGMIVLKLYLIDVWQMSNEFRIVSFIVLGILILITSFIYQRLKKLVENLFDQTTENKKADS